MPNSDPDLLAGPPLKKARYYWQVKGHKKLNESNEQLTSLQENDVGDTGDNNDCFRDFPEETVPPFQTESVPTFSSESAPVCLPDATEHRNLIENNSQVDFVNKPPLTQSAKDDNKDDSAISLRNKEMTHRCSVVNASLSVCSVDASAASDISQEMAQDGHKQPVITSAESTVTVPLNGNRDHSFLISGCSSVDYLHVEQSSDEKCNSSMDTFSGNSVSLGVDHSTNGGLGGSCYENPEPGTSKDFIVEKGDRNLSIQCDRATDILALESTNTNFMDLIQTKVDIQARKLNLLNMVHTNSRQDNTVQEITVPKKNHSSNDHLSPITTSDVLSASCSAATFPDHNVTSEQPTDVRPESPPLNLDFSASSNSPDEPTFLSRWQSQHTAKAIVDNAINKTLEEMGLTPDVSTSAWNRLFLEDEGISEAIRFRGLWLRESGLQSPRIHPLISQITGASEQVFERTLDNAAAQLFRPVTRESVVMNLSPTQSYSHVMDSDPSLISQTGQLDPVHTEPSESNIEELDLMGSQDVREHTASNSDSPSGSEDHVEDICADSPSDEAASAAADVLQFALNAAITSKGLSIRYDQAL